MKIEGSSKVISPEDVVIPDVFTEFGIDKQEDKIVHLNNLIESVDNGVDFDDDGNIIDTNKNIVLDYNEVQTKLKAILETNKDKNTDTKDKDTDTKVVEDTDTDNANNNTNEDENTNVNDIDVISSIQTEVGLEFKDEDGNAFSYENTAEGIIKYIKDVKEYVEQEAETNSINKFVEGHPELVDAFAYYIEHGTLDNYKTTTMAYQTLDINKLNDNQKLMVIRELYRVKNLPNSHIESVVTSLKPGEQLNNLADEAIKELKAIDKTIQKEKQNKVKEAAELKVQAAKQVYNEAITYVNNGVVDGIKIPDNKKKSFVDYLFKPIKDGKTQEMIDAETETLEKRVANAYKRFAGVDVNKIATDKAKELNLNALLKAKKDSKSGSQPNGNDKRGSIKNIGQVKLSEIQRGD